MDISPCCETSYCPCQEFDCDCEKHYDPTGHDYPEHDDETGERYGNWEWSGDYWYQPKNAESYSAESPTDDELEMWSYREEDGSMLVSIDEAGDLHTELTYKDGDLINLKRFQKRSKHRGKRRNY